jgi:hypothetical protein
MNLPAFRPGPQVYLKGPRVAWLAVEIPIVLGDVIRIQDAVLIFRRIAVREIAANEFRVDCAIDDDMRDMDVLWP